MGEMGLMVDLRSPQNAFCLCGDALRKRQSGSCQKIVCLLRKERRFLDVASRTAQNSPVHIVIAPDKFKGSLTAIEAAAAIRAGFARIFPDATFDLLPLADGGEGILEAFSRGVSDAKTHVITVKNALGRDVRAEFLLSGKSAVIESSQANGLYLIPQSDRDITRSSTFGVGELILAAIAAGAESILIGIGGSATNDAALGLAAALGCAFLDRDGKKVEPIPANIPRIASIDSSEMPPLPPITVACDVANPLLGERGATRVYGPQKGLLPGQADEMEAALSHLAELANAHFGTDFTATPGAGAAGGLGYGLMTFCNARLESGFHCIAKSLGAEEKIAAADLVITAEGSLDAQTLEGKTPHGVSQLARKHRKPVYALAGRLADEEILLPHFDGIASLVNAPMTIEEAIANAPKLLENAAARLAHTIRSATSSDISSHES
jgi:glycerate kinase